MRVHVVATSPLGDQVLARKARYLAEGLGWSIGENPRRDVDVNVFFPYIDYAERFPGWDLTKTVAYFTHKDTNRKEKEGWWDLAKRSVDVRVTSSKLNLPDLQSSGSTYLARPPVDATLFSRKKPTDNDVLLIGISGVSYGDGRKGEDLIDGLMRSPIGRRCKWVASGRGWTISHRWRRWEDMAEFYQGIDIYLCASRVEGVPMPPLEALSCGTAVLIPSGVGIMDDLPEIPGIRHYRVGDLEDLISKTELLCDDIKMGIVDGEELRASVAEYSIENWCADFRVAVESLIYDYEGALERYPVRISGGWEGKAGMYCVAFGSPSRECAKTCIRSFKDYMPEVPIAFGGTRELGAGEDLFIHLPDVDIGGRLGKLSVYEVVPEGWEYILYMDADTETVGDLSFLFQVLADGWDILICKDMSKYHVAWNMIRPDNKAEFDETIRKIGTGEVMQYNGGVFGFRRNDRTKRLFERWLDEWHKYAARDQGALLRALYEDPVRVYVLGNQWNASDRYPYPSGDLAVIHHNMTARRWGGLIYGRTDSDEAWERVEKVNRPDDRN